MHILVLLAACALPCAAAPADELQRQIDQAKQELRQATDQLDRARDRARQFADRENELLRRANMLAADADRLNAEAATLERDRATAQAALPQLEQQFDAARDQLLALQKELEDAKSTQARIAQESARRSAAMEAEFKTSDSLKAAQGSIATLQVQLDNRLAEVRMVLAANPAYGALRAEADRLKAEVDTLRKTTGTDQALLASSSQMWMAAETRAGEMVTKAELADEALRALRVQQAEARKREKKLVDDFEISRRDDPAIRQLAADGRATEMAIQRAQAEIARGESGKAACESRLREARNLIATADEEAAATRLRARSLRNDYENTMRELALAQLELRRAEADREDADRIARAAAEKLSKLTEQEKPRG